MPTPQEINVLWSLVGKIGAIVAVVVALIKGVKYLRSQTSVAKLECKTADHDKALEMDRKHFERIDNHIGEIDNRINKMDKDRMAESKRINESLSMLRTSLSAMMNQMIDGNNKEQMIKERDELMKKKKKK